MRRAFLLFALLPIAPVACSGSTPEQPPLSNDGDASVDGTTDDVGSFDVGAPDVELGCPSEVLCGAAGTCCKSGEECVDGACATACSSGVRCGATCCAATDVCLVGKCTAPGAACKDSFDCDEGEFCEPTLGKCLPQPPAGACEYRPPVAKLEPILEWSWTTSAIKPTFVQVINMPVVVDLDKDKTPDVVIVTSDNYDADLAGYLRALDGKTGVEKWPATADVYKDANQVNPRGTPAAADLDGDGAIEIVSPMRAGGVIAFKADGSLLWKSRRADGSAYVGKANSATIALADMDADGKAEIVYGGVILDHTGKVISGEGREFLGGNATGYGPVSIVADVDGDGQQEVVGGNRAYKKDGTLVWNNGLTDGYPAIADFDKDGKPELVVIAQGKVRVHDAKTGARLAELLMPGAGSGGPPTIADFDGDGVMEIASANGSKYNVFEYEAAPTPKLTAKWSADTHDLSSNVTGSSVFDFEGDGAAEVVYNDECYVRVYSGKDGKVLFQQPSSTATIHEYPILADVDGDGNTEFLVVSNNLNHKIGGVSCPSDVTPRAGVFVYGDKNDKWVRTRKVWNQHAYHITNVNGDGTVPWPEPVSWGASGYNNYRVSSQGAGVFNAPDLRVDLEVSTASCPAALGLRARVKNAGTLGVPAGVKVRFHAGADASAPLIVEKATTTALLPGGSEVVTAPFTPSGAGPFSFFVNVDGASSGSAIKECLEDNNTGSAGGSKCPSVK
ncbi:MAG: VCBS repeat-containing protein [Deltaproteobacteria bacterium]|nr:VCBS repeat-containing protein [Deltaproteobacteria bacterium]